MRLFDHFWFGKIEGLTMLYVEDDGSRSPLATREFWELDAKRGRAGLHVRVILPRFARLALDHPARAIMAGVDSRAWTGRRQGLRFVPGRAAVKITAQDGREWRW